jgi:uncharacterized protein (DUF305 family)
MTGVTGKARTTLAVLLLAVALALGACGNGSGSTTDSAATAGAGQRNDADVAFATGMIPHHQQAVTMADLAAERATDSRVKELATKVKAAQAPEIETMSGWLTGWGKRVPRAGEGHDMSDHAHGPDGEEVGGMMSDKDLYDLVKAVGPAFDRRWLDLMIRHHEGAVTMARTEIDTGAFPAAKTLAGQIVQSQSTEIEEMKGLLAALP